MLPKRALITASANGIGAATARALAAEGYEVVVSDIDEAAGEAVAKEIGGRFVRCDLAQADQIEALVAAAGPVSVLVNNGGVSGPTAPVPDITPDEWNATFAVNVTAMFLACRLVVPQMTADGGGTIVNLSSAAGKIGYPNRSPYAASKWAVLGFTASLAREVATAGIRVNAIMPASVRGPRIQSVIAAYADRNALPLAEAEAHYLARQATKAFVEPEEVARTIVFLASGAARSINGAFLPIDGGFD
ncbi:SDR family NAD(P)-dependent oxidoreductase [Amorphus coralli]|uniref:SDR family NAD(P)-dependent oxidoreductase n=1 Tax=Amorphus coralli TaxID=340680 RepID=UPI000360ECD5|nr:SDR family oxidoreductase [Amorphus coralli]